MELLSTGIKTYFSGLLWDNEGGILHDYNINQFSAISTPYNIRKAKVI
jgi:hypothetical protein